MLTSQIKHICLKSQILKTGFFSFWLRSESWHAALISKCLSILALYNSVVHLCCDNVGCKWAWLCSTAANCTQHAKIHDLSTATVKWQTKLVLLWIVNCTALTVPPSAVYITMHMTWYNNTVQIGLILMQTDPPLLFQRNSSTHNSVVTEKKAEEWMIAVFIKAVPVCIWTSWEGLAEGQRWTIFGYWREIMGAYKSRHENPNKSSCAISLYRFLCRSLEEVSKNGQNLCVIYTHTHNVLQCVVIPEVLHKGDVDTMKSRNSEFQTCDKCSNICRQQAVSIGQSQRIYS